MTKHLAWSFFGYWYLKFPCILYLGYFNGHFQLYD